MFSIVYMTKRFIILLHSVLSMFYSVPAFINSYINAPPNVFLEYPVIGHNQTLKGASLA